MNQAEILQQIVIAIRDAIGEDWIQEFEIDGDTRFDSDLEIESIEFVAIAAQLQQRFGKNVDIVQWLSQRSMDELIALRVVDIAKFVERELILSAEA